jgi:5-methylcytosine-specific restriction protein A
LATASICQPRAKRIDRGSRDWYQLQRWRNQAKYQLQLQPFCRFCLRNGRATFATIADHIEPHHGDWNLFWLGALQSLCAQCHNSSKRLLEHGKTPITIGPDGWPLEPIADDSD